MSLDKAACSQFVWNKTRKMSTGIPIIIPSGPISPKQLLLENDTLGVHYDLFGVDISCDIMLDSNVVSDVVVSFVCVYVFGRLRARFTCSFACLLLFTLSFWCVIALTCV